MHSVKAISKRTRRKRKTISCMPCRQFLLSPQHEPHVLPSLNAREVPSSRFYVPAQRVHVSSLPEDRKASRETGRNVEAGGAKGDLTV